MVFCRINTAIKLFKTVQHYLKGATQKLRVTKFTDFVKQIVGIGVIDPVMSKYDLIFVLSNRYTPSLSCRHFFENLKFFLSTSGSDNQSNTPPHDTATLSQLQDL